MHEFQMWLLEVTPHWLQIVMYLVNFATVVGLSSYLGYQLGKRKK